MTQALPFSISLLEAMTMATVATPVLAGDIQDDPGKLSLPESTALPTGLAAAQLCKTRRG